MIVCEVKIINKVLLLLLMLAGVLRMWCGKPYRQYSYAVTFVSLFFCLCELLILLVTKTYEKLIITLIGLRMSRS